MKSVSRAVTALAAVFAVLGCSQVTTNGTPTEALRLKEDPASRYMSAEEVAHAIAALPEIKYPATQGEINAVLGTGGRKLPAMGSIGGGLHGPVATDQYLQIDLTDPDAPRRYVLLLWFSPDWRALSSDDFAKVHDIAYAEILLEDQNIHATFVAQSNRYPYANLSYATRRVAPLRNPPAN